MTRYRAFELTAAISLATGIGLGLLLAAIEADFARWWAQDAAAWTQAFGSVIAIGVAVWVPWQIHRNEQRIAASDRAARRLGLSHRIYPEMLVFRKTLDNLQGLPLVLRDYIFDLPSGLTATAPDLYLLDDTGAILLQMIGAAGAHNALTKSAWWVARHRYDQTDHLRALAKERIAEIKTSFEEAIAGLESILGLPASAPPEGSA